MVVVALVVVAWGSRSLATSPPASFVVEVVDVVVVVVDVVVVVVVVVVAVVILVVALVVHDFP